jgi:hypothetical protein
VPGAGRREDESRRSGEHETNNGSRSIENLRETAVDKRERKERASETKRELKEKINEGFGAGTNSGHFFPRPKRRDEGFSSED